ncbi:MAG TPA: sigma-E factor negative regulatory protein [Gammaproteobacteria bacterium]|nr:sigma-E factor negative regulatory protein [Gammaproteobacteria bacterium]
MSNEAFKTQLSALVDDEVRPHEIPFLARRLSRDPEAIEQLGSYFMIGDAIRRQLPEVMDTRLVDRVRAALEAEPAFQLQAAAEPALARRLLRPLAGLGVAASVAMVAVSYWSESDSVTKTQQPSGLVAATPQMVTPQPVQAMPLTPQPQNQWNRLDPEVQKRLQGYLVNHSEHASTGQLGGVLNYVRIAGQQQARD